MLSRLSSALLKSQPVFIHLGAPLVGHSFSSQSDAERTAMANKLLYRSKQRGFLELDLLVGLWAEKNIPTMSMDKLKHLTTVLDQENPDLFKWLTGQLPPSEEMAANPAFQAIKSAVEHQLAKCPTKAYASSGREWVRGWSDTGTVTGTVTGVNQ